MSTKVDSSNNVEFGTSAQLLPMQCCVQYGDCLEHLSNMSDDFVDYTITSPPYNVGTVKGKSKYQNTKDNYTQEEYFEWSKNVINQLLRVTKNEVFYNIQMLTNNKVALMKLLGHFAEQVKEIII